MPNDYLSEVTKRRRRRRFYFILTVIVLFLYAVVVASVLVVLKTPIFHFQKLEVMGNQYVDSQDIVSLLWAKVISDPNRGWKSLSGFSNMLIWPKSLTGSDLTLIPQLKALDIEKDYSRHVLTVRVTERNFYGVWCLLKDRKCFWFDSEGVIFKQAPDAQGSLIPVVHDYSQSGLGLNSKVLPPEFLANLFSIFRVLQASGLGVQEIRLNDISLEELEADTINGPKLYFSFRFPSDNNLAVIKKLMFQGGFVNLQYIDFRVENRAYYK